MLTQTVLAHNAQNRRAEKPQISLTRLQERIHFQDYQDLLEWVFQISNELQLLPSTKYLARVYFDITLSFFQDSFTATSCLDLLLACLSLAIKFNETRSVSDLLTPETLLTNANIAFSRDSYFGLEMRILTAIRFRFMYTTPYDYVDIFMARFPFFPKMRQALPIFIEFANIQGQSCDYTSEELFYGAVLAICECGGLIFSEFQRQVFMGLTDCWQRANLIKVMIVDGISLQGGAQCHN